MAGLHTYLLATSFDKLKFLAVTGGVLKFGEVEPIKGKLYFTKHSFEVTVIKLPAFFKLLKIIGENFTFFRDANFKEDNVLPTEDLDPLETSQDLFPQSSSENHEPPKKQGRGKSGPIRCKHTSARRGGERWGRKYPSRTLKKVLP